MFYLKKKNYKLNAIATKFEFTTFYRGILLKSILIQISLTKLRPCPNWRLLLLLLYSYGRIAASSCVWGFLKYTLATDVAVAVAVAVAANSDTTWYLKRKIIVWCLMGTKQIIVRCSYLQTGDTIKMVDWRSKIAYLSAFRERYQSMTVGQIR